jgi:hypothetical protein
MTFVETGHLWKYWDLGTDPGAAWRTPAFNDTSWQEGPSQLGYGSDNEGSGTELSTPAARPWPSRPRACAPS